MPRKPGQVPSPEMMEVLLAYEAGKLTADVAAERFVALLEKSDVPINFSVDGPFREAILRLAIAKGRLPPDTVLDHDS